MMMERWRNKGTGMRRGAVLLAAAALLLVPRGAAAYSASSDTGVEALDYIENARRTERENRLTKEQEVLLAAAEAMRAHLRHPWDAASGKIAPIAFEGDDLTYDQRTGAFSAKGKVHILQADARSYDGADAEGNLVTHDVRLPGKSHILQMTEGAARVTLDGYDASYNYERKVGSMERAEGKIDRYYFKGTRFEFYPDHYVVYGAMATKCGAKKPDYHWSAETITIYPGEKMVLEKMRFHLKGRTMYARDRYVVDLRPDAKGPVFPAVGYDSDNGWWIAHDFAIPVAKNTTASLNLLWMSHEGWRSNYDVTYRAGNLATGVTYGHFEDGDNKWIHKQPSFFLNYGSHIGDSPYAYSIALEKGRWYNDGIHSTHTYYGLGIARDPIAFSGYRLSLGAGYSITQESYDDSRSDGMNFDAVLTKEFDLRWAAYLGAHYRTTTTRNAVFDFGLDDYNKKLEGGMSYRMTERDRFLVGVRYNVDDGRASDIDYYWHHDMHCAQLVLRYRSLSNTWNVKLEFTPW